MKWEAETSAAYVSKKLHLYTTNLKQQIYLETQLLPGLCSDICLYDRMKHHIFLLRWSCAKGEGGGQTKSRTLRPEASVRFQTPVCGSGNKSTLFRVRKTNEIHCQ